MSLLSVLNINASFAKLNINTLIILTPNFLKVVSIHNDNTTNNDKTKTLKPL